MADGTAAANKVLNIWYRCGVAVGIEVKGTGGLGLEMDRYPV
jgi:hypothetical protein